MAFQQVPVGVELMIAWHCHDCQMQGFRQGSIKAVSDHGAFACYSGSGRLPIAISVAVVLQVLQDESTLQLFPGLNRQLQDAGTHQMSLMLVHNWWLLPIHSR